jgi:hypothetical protein
MVSLQAFALLEQPAEPLSRAAAGEQQKEDRGEVVSHGVV